MSGRWSVLVLSTLKLNLPGIIYCEQEEEASSWVIQMRGTASPSALVSRKKLDLDVPFQRTAYHLVKKTTRNDPDGVEQTTSQTIPVVGFIYQMSRVHSVSLKAAPQTHSQIPADQTAVIRLLTAAAWAPSTAWDSLQRGKPYVMKEELLSLLGKETEAAKGINDVFKLELQGRIMSCCARVSTSVLPAIFAVSGKTWLFCYPLAREAPRYPTVWANEVWPSDLTPLYTRARGWR